MPATMSPDSSIGIKVNRFISLGMGTQYEGTLELNPPQISVGSI